ncbi:MAG: ABC transporter ATP-binding protein [Desulfosalsimonas sp.]|uniref:ABC transporter ATP-binding protein n=1 Tax=Desulfosalsimonas sp. TaxID=3073848 RepID=UPI003970B946
MSGERDIFAEKELGKARDTGLLRRLYPFAAPYRVLLAVALVLMAAVTVLELAIPYVTKEAIDRYIVPEKNISMPGPGVSADEGAAEKAREPGQTSSDAPSETSRNLSENEQLSGLGRAAMVLVAIILLNLAVNFLHVMIVEYTAQHVMHDLRLKLFDHIQRLSVRFFNHNSVGRLVTRTTNDIQNMHEMLTSVIIFVLKDLFLLLGITAVLFAIDWQLSLAVYVIFPLVFYAGFRFAGTARQAFRTLRIKAAEINTKFSETIGGVGIIQLFGQEKNNYDNFRRINHENFLAGMRQITVFAMFMPFIELMSSVGLAVVIFAGGSGILAGRVSLGELVMFISYVRMFFRPIRDIAEKYNITQNAMSSAERIFQILDEDDRIPEPRAQDAEAVPKRFEKISADNLWFGYQPEQPVLKGIDFTLDAGRTLAVVGPTGAGKTSLIHLLVRFYDPDQGAIRINDIDIRKFASGALRSKIALVSQEPFLFSGTIFNNIFGANGTPDEQTVARILDQSRSRSFIQRLPDGIHTRLTEQGATLSSGQRQLISIARALAADPELIIFDEATSYIDSETEASIQDALSNLMAERTSIVIAHRLSTARIADTILVLHHGQIAESGSHAQLMTRNGFYKRLVEIQG